MAGFASLVPLLLFVGITLLRDVGWHWVMSFYPPLFLVLGQTNGHSPSARSP